MEFFTFKEEMQDVCEEPAVSEEMVINKVSNQIYWWLGEREKKLRSMDHSNMSINPMLMPIIMELHEMKNSEEYAKFAISSHLMQSYSTGYGKLVDEKILPNVFGTKKLTTKFRKNMGDIYKQACFDEIDHLIYKKNGEIDLLSLKASKWTIQLTAAVQINSAFSDIKKLSTSDKIKVNKIYVGVFYGKEDSLTDKYDILRGINRGKNHDVTDIRDFVDIKSGKDFWSWINKGEKNTQYWVNIGQQIGTERFKKSRGYGFEKLLEDYEKNFVIHSKNFFDEFGKMSSSKILKEING